MLHTVLSGIRLTFFVAALVSFLVARLFLQGDLLGMDGGNQQADLWYAFGLSFFAALGLFLCVVGIWSFRLESHLREARIFRLVFARVILGMIGGVCIVALGVMAFLPAAGQYVTAAGIVLSLVGMSAVFAQPKRDPRARAGHR